jgi:hypothetical protein
MKNSFIYVTTIFLTFGLSCSERKNNCESDKFTYSNSKLANDGKLEENTFSCEDELIFKKLTKNGLKLSFCNFDKNKLQRIKIFKDSLVLLVERKKNRFDFVIYDNDDNLLSFSTKKDGLFCIESFIANSNRSNEIECFKQSEIQNLSSIFLKRTNTKTKIAVDINFLNSNEWGWAYVDSIKPYKLNELIILFKKQKLKSNRIVFDKYDLEKARLSNNKYVIAISKTPENRYVSSYFPITDLINGNIRPGLIGNGRDSQNFYTLNYVKKLIKENTTLDLADINFI